MSTTIADLRELLELVEDRDSPPLTELLEHQRPPAGKWEGWLIQAGRGAGKTAAMAKYVTDHVDGPPCIKGAMPHKMALIAPTIGDAVESADRHPVCLRSLTPAGKLRQRPGGTIFSWPNGSEIKLFGVHTSEDVERLRAGGNNCLVWVEELAIWKQLETGWDQMQLGLRIGPWPHWVGSSTPKRRKKFREIVEDEGIVRTYAHMRDNPHLDESFQRRMDRMYADTALGRQELAGELIEDVEGAYWNIAQIDASRLAPTDLKFARVIVAIDPPGGATEAGIVTAGLIAGACPCGETSNLPHAVVIADDSLFPSGPNHWASVAVNAYHDHRADKLVAEMNYGGDMVLNTVANIDATVHRDKVVASRGKIIRAEPVAGLYGDPSRPETWERSRVHHLGSFPALEDEMTAYTLADAGTWSPNRLDALVWAITELGLSEWRPARIASAANVQL